MNLIAPSIIKTAVEYYLYEGGNRLYIEHLIPAIKREKSSEEYIKLYYPEVDDGKVKGYDVFHSLYIRGSKEDGLLYGYVNYFDVIQCLVLLNDHYDGPDIEHSYAYNVVTREETTDAQEIRLSLQEVEAILNVPYPMLVTTLLDRANDYMRKVVLIQFHQRNDAELNEFIETEYKKYIDQEIDDHELSFRIARKIVELCEPMMMRADRHQTI